MKQIAMVYESWFMNQNEDWDSNDHLMIVGGDEKLVTLRPWGSPAMTEKFRENYPDAEMTDIVLTMHRGKLEKNDRLRTNWPEHWKLIRDTWARFEDA